MLAVVRNRRIFAKSLPAFSSEIYVSEIYVKEIYVKETIKETHAL